jgi:SPP1 gp7 family putative phage head morphogenesis protein
MPRRRRPIKPMRYPIGHEYRYRQDLLLLSKHLKLAVKKHLVPAVPDMVAEASDIHALPHGNVVRHDAWQDDLRRAMDRIAKDMVDPTNTAIKRMLARGPQINQYNKDEWRKLIRSQYGVDPTKEDPDRMNALLKNWAHNNALLIKDIPFKTMNQIKEATVDALMSGKNTDDMTSDVYDIMSERTDVTDSRARLIARDQVAKLNGGLTRQRQEDIGVSSYTWRTVGDERVRDTHQEVDGQVFTWDNPPSETDDNHPGEDYQCRCWAEPILPEVVDMQAELLDTEDAELEDA